MDVLLAQLCPVAGDPAANAAHAAQALADHADVELAIFPELFLQGYDLGAAAGLAVAPESAALDRVRAAAGEAATAVMIGFAERAPGGAVHNSLAAIDERGQIAAVYRKTQLFGDERDVFSAGEELIVVDLAGRRVGPLLCFDAEFPELARALAAAGADLLVTAAANMAPYYDDHELATRARSLDNRLSHAYVNRVGKEAGLRFVGGSRVIGADGSVQLQCPTDGEALSVAPIDPPDRGDAAVDYLAQVPRHLPVKLIEAVSGGRT